MPWYRLLKSGAPYFSRAPIAGLEPLEEGEPEPGAPASEPPQDPAPPKRSKRNAKPDQEA